MAKKSIANEDRRRGLFAVSWGHAIECIESGNIPEWLTLTYENVSGDANIDHIISAHDLPSEMRDSLLAIPLALDDCWWWVPAPPKLATRKQLKPLRTALKKAVRQMNKLEQKQQVSVDLKVRHGNEDIP